jgi:hypothetical protein
VYKRVYTSGSKPLGLTWANWVVRWWRWCSAEPDETNPASDRTGLYCGRNQRYSEVWFLAGTFGGYAKRRCVVPLGKALFFPVITDRISYAEHGFLKTERELFGYAMADLDSTGRLEVSVDGEQVDKAGIARVRTDLFKFSLLRRGQLSSPKDTSYAVSDGYWVFLMPLSSGDHSLYFLGEKLKYDEFYLNRSAGKKSIFRVEVDYCLVVE